MWVSWPDFKNFLIWTTTRWDTPRKYCNVTSTLIYACICCIHVYTRRIRLICMAITISVFPALRETLWCNCCRSIPLSYVYRHEYNKYMHRWGWCNITIFPRCFATSCDPNQKNLTDSEMIWKFVGWNTFSAVLLKKKNWSFFFSRSCW